ELGCQIVSCQLLSSLWARPFGRKLLFGDCYFVSPNRPSAPGSASLSQQSCSVRFTDSIPMRLWLRRSQSFSSRESFWLRLILLHGHFGYRSACISDGISLRTSSLASG